MPCYRPNVILVDKTPIYKGEKAKILQFINSIGKDFIGYEHYDRQNEEFFRSGNQKEFQKIPCGECAGCQETYSKAWAIRCIKEAELYKHNYFVTLTYDDEHLPKDDEIIDRQTGVIYETPYYDKGYLKDSDLSKFIKDIRARWKYHYDHTGIRFFACGEYGSVNRRPHYHVILFNCPINPSDLKIHSINTNGDTLWENDEIQQLWGKGFVSIAEVNFDTCAYVARYVMKKSGPRKRREDYFENGETPEFIRMSRAPGIGKAYYDMNKENIYENDEIIYKGHKLKIGASKPPAYYDRLYDAENPSDLRTIKNSRKAVAMENNKLKNTQTTLPEKDRLALEGRRKTEAWNTLKRNKID